MKKSTLLTGLDYLKEIDVLQRDVNEYDHFSKVFIGNWEDHEIVSIEIPAEDPDEAGVYIVEPSDTKVPFDQLPEETRLTIDYLAALQAAKKRRIAELEKKIAELNDLEYNVGE